MKRPGTSLGVLVVLLTAALPAPLARSGIVIPLPTLSTEFNAKPTPLPAPSEGRVPVSLRLADAISTTDGSHPPAAKEVRFEFGRGFRLDLGGVPRCPWAPVQSYPRFNWARCADASIGGGKLRWEVAFPEEEPARVGAPAVIYRGRANELLIRTEVPAPRDSSQWPAPAGAFRPGSATSSPTGASPVPLRSSPAEAAASAP